MPMGQVKRWNDEKGFGFIAPEDAAAEDGATADDDADEQKTGQSQCRRQQRSRQQASKKLPGQNRHRCRIWLCDVRLSGSWTSVAP